MSLFKISLTIFWGLFETCFFLLSLVLFPLQLGYILDILSPSSFFCGALIKLHEENHALVVVSGGWWMVCEWGVIITIDGIWLGTNHHGDAAETAVEWWWWWGWVRQWRWLMMMMTMMMAMMYDRKRTAWPAKCPRQSITYQPALVPPTVTQKNHKNKKKTTIKSRSNKKTNTHKNNPTVTNSHTKITRIKKDKSRTKRKNKYPWKQPHSLL